MKTIVDPLVAVPALTRKEKLALWAGMIRAYPNRLQLYHNLEYMTYVQLTRITVHATDQTAFGIALGSGAFGLPSTMSLTNFMQHFELSQRELHEFSCDCGGAISNRDMASRIEKLAG